MKALYLSLFILTSVSTISAQRVVTKPVVTNPDIIKSPIKKNIRFNYEEALKFMKPGYIQSKWVPYKMSDKTMQATTKKTSAKDQTTVENGVTCTTVTKKLDVNSASFMATNSDLDLSKFVPGAIFQGNDFLAGNYNREVKANRLPIKISSSDPKFGPAIELRNPDISTITDAIKAYRKNITNGNDTNKTLEKKMRMFYSTDEALTSFLISAGASGYGAKINTAYRTSSASTKVILTIDAYRSIFAIDHLPTGEYNAYFSAIPSNVKENNLVIISSVSYGTRIFANLTIDCNSTQDAAVLAASYSGYGFSGKLDIEGIKKHSSKKIVLNYKQVGGGESKNTLTLNIDQLNNTLDDLLTKASYNNVHPIAYNIRSLDGENMGINSTVDNYKETTCFTEKKLRKVYAKIYSGKDGKNDDNFLRLHLKDGNNKFVAEYRQSKNLEFKKNSWTQDYLIMNLLGQNAKQTDFINGGKLEISTDHRGGKDDWYIDQVILVIEYDDNSKQEITWKMKTGENAKSIRQITKDNNSFALLFDTTMTGHCPNCTTEQPAP